jgi:hypothetical protein
MLYSLGADCKPEELTREVNGGRGVCGKLNFPDESA